MSNRVADPNLPGGLDAGDDISHITGGKLFARAHIEFEHPDFICMILLPGRNEFYEIVGADSAVENLVIGDDAAEGIEHGVEDQGLKRSLGIPLRRRNSFHNRLQYLGNTHAGLAAGADHFLRIAAEKIDYLVFNLVGLCAVKVALVDHRDDLEIVVDGHVEIGDCLGLDALRGVDDEKSPFAGGYRARNFIGEVDVSRSVDKVEHIILPSELILHLDSVALDRDSAFALQIHIIEHLGLHVLGVDGFRIFKQTVGKRRLAVVDMGNDAKIANILHNLQNYKIFCEFRQNFQTIASKSSWNSRKK